MPKAKEITANQGKRLLRTLQARFDAHMHRHAGLDWTAVQRRLESNSAKLPKSRRSLCYGREALQARKQHKPKSNAVEMAAAMGATLLTVDQYRQLQRLGQFDTTTSSWVHTPAKIRKLGGALFCDRRYDTVFVYHNGAESYYAGRGFRCSLRV